MFSFLNSCAIVCISFCAASDVEDESLMRVVSLLAIDALRLSVAGQSSFRALFEFFVMCR